jgi:hypothetical protein
MGIIVDSLYPIFQCHAYFVIPLQIPQSGSEHPKQGMNPKKQKNKTIFINLVLAHISLHFDEPMGLMF